MEIATSKLDKRRCLEPDEQGHLCIVVGKHQEHFASGGYTWPNDQQIDN